MERRNRRANTSSQSTECIKPSKRIALISLKIQKIFFSFLEKNKVMKTEKSQKGLWSYKPQNVGFAVGFVFVHVFIFPVVRNTHHVQNEYLDMVLCKNTSVWA